AVRIGETELGDLAGDGHLLAGVKIDREGMMGLRGSNRGAGQSGGEKNSATLHRKLSRFRNLHAIGWRGKRKPARSDGTHELRPFRRIDLLESELVARRCLHGQGACPPERRVSHSADFTPAQGLAPGRSMKNESVIVSADRDLVRPAPPHDEGPRGHINGDRCRHPIEVSDCPRFRSWRIPFSRRPYSENSIAKGSTAATAKTTVAAAPTMNSHPSTVVCQRRLSFCGSAIFPSLERDAGLVLRGADGQRGLDAGDVGYRRQLAGQEFLEALQVPA